MPLLTLPTELLLAIIKDVEDLYNLATTCRVLNTLCACHLDLTISQGGLRHITISPFEVPQAAYRLIPVLFSKPSVRVESLVLILWPFYNSMGHQLRNLATFIRRYKTVRAASFTLRLDRGMIERAGDPYQWKEDLFSVAGMLVDKGCKDFTFTVLFDPSSHTRYRVLSCKSCSCSRYSHVRPHTFLLKICDISMR